MTIQACADWIVFGGRKRFWWSWLSSPGSDATDSSRDECASETGFTHLSQRVHVDMYVYIYI